VKKQLIPGREIVEKNTVDSRPPILLESRGMNRIIESAVSPLISPVKNQRENNRILKTSNDFLEFQQIFKDFMGLRKTIMDLKTVHQIHRLQN